MHGDVSRRARARWNWRHAVELCAGSRDADATSACFRERVAAGDGLEAAIAACGPDGVVPASGGEHEGRYAACSGHPLHPGESCGEGRCADGALEARVFEAWRTQFMTVHELSRAAFDDHMEIWNVEVDRGPKSVFWRVDYVFVVDWVRSRQSESVHLGAHPLARPPTDGEIDSAVALAIEPAERFHLADVVAPEAVRSSFAECASDVEIDWCHIDFANVTGELRVGGTAVADRDANRCVDAEVRLSDGRLMRCRDAPCRLH